MDINPDSKLYGIRYLMSHALSLRVNKAEDDDFNAQIYMLYVISQFGAFSKAQLGQDVFALAMSGFKREGYFVEVGAHDGEWLSNTWLLEQKFGWQGLLIEPNPIHAETLQRRRAKLIQKAAWNESGQTLRFHATADSALSTAEGIVQTDQHDRTQYTVVEVETMTLNDVLEREGAPSEIDYMSIDIEGAELIALEGLDLNRWRINSLSVEHNGDLERAAAFDALFARHGLIRVCTAISDFDAFYVRQESFEQWQASNRRDI